MSEPVKGTRRDYVDGEPLPVAGEYGRWPGDSWYGVSPTGLLAGLSKHDVTEHADGTISASPSILVQRGANGPSWHGFLERGIWREA